MSLASQHIVGSESFFSKTSGIGGKLRKKSEDFNVEEVVSIPGRSHWIWMQDSSNGKHQIVKIKAKNWDTHVLVKELSRRLNIGQKSIGFAGTKDKRAITTQHFSVKTSMEKLSSVDLENIELEFLHSSVKPIRLGNLVGNKFKIRVTNSSNRDHINDIFSELDGFFPNYFGVQRFGAVRPITHIVGEKIVQGNYEGAVLDYLTLGSPNYAGHEGREYLLETKDFTKSLEKFPSHMLFERQLLGHLSRNKGDYTGAILQLPESLSKMLVHGYQSLIFNKVLDMRIKEGMDACLPQIGDYIMPADGYGGPDQRVTIEVTERNQSKLSKRCREGKAWVAGLLPGANSKFSKGRQGELEKEVMDDFGVKFGDFIIDDIHELSSYGMYRPLFQKYNDIEVDYNSEDPIFSFWLHKGTYATSFLREIMKSSDVTVY
ncbi:MAG: tRNA pseudouridine(13) synthase TruD [Marine Group III euryarchaeote CG-Epi1]|uniref:Probable tRNA pseudouridine synthase D n=1 Tax=Marine Group III euryarchaeote CG-Epi1 TaxID=1888995 RepID=A0A1J5TGF9_9ARCH|nr:MAG: tRNA pseudouridine(13) synthase TruD [Marine Group III euryarchaeote CG-Epi1]|tara:strand:- start:2412 stop:3704 length:1293 start_codon:yes stop_codon:yes gene_type:complete